jgi:hypothetical protein
MSSPPPSSLLLRLQSATRLYKTTPAPSKIPQIQTEYKELFLYHKGDARKYEMDIQLWKSIHYVTIQYLRRKKENATMLNEFLEKTAAYYKAMIEDLKQQYGLNEVVKKMENTLSTDVDQNVQMDVRWALVACHRFLIYLGDLGKYRSLTATTITTKNQEKDKTYRENRNAAIAPNS